MITHRLLLFLAASLAGVYVYADAGDSVRINDIHITGNRHTRDFIILREFPFKQGQTISSEQFQQGLQQGYQWIINLNLFNQVDTIVSYTETGDVNLSVHVVERWYYWPVPEFKLADRNFNQWWLTKDFNRVNYGFRFYLFNLGGRNQTLKLTLIDGYTKLYEARYTIPYINKKHTVGFVTNLHFSRNREIWYDTRDNKLQFFKDEEKFTIKRVKVSAGLQFRKDLRVLHKAEAGYNHYSIADTVARGPVNPDYLAGGKTRQDEYFARYTYTADYRDSRNYPLTGHYTKAEVQSTLVNGTQGPYYASLSISHHQYRELAHRLYGAASLKGRALFGRQQPYINLQALGYDDYVRGYEYYVIDGEAFVLAKAGVKYALIPSDNWYIPLIPVKNYRYVNRALYLSVFADAGYVNSTYKNNVNPINNTLQAGIGIGLDVVMYYDRIARLEYTINKNQKAGLYLHFTFGI